ncbi:MAG: histidine phosphatase family protein [Candidatus Protochlamydia sp.]|nr:histidine phosphatase family protein [Candidatus Protochlamydia sp.]
MNTSCLIETIKFSIDPDFIVNSDNSMPPTTTNPDLMKYIWSKTEEITSEKRKGTLFYVMRHGETPSNVEKKIIGCEVDEDLTNKGIEDAIKIAKKIGALQENGKIHLGSIYSSPLVRAAKTANIVAQELKLGLEMREDLKEINWGNASKFTDEERTSKWGEEEKQLINKYPDLTDLWNHLPAIPNAEKYNSLLERTIKEIQKISRENQQKEIALVCHGRLIRTLTAKCLNTEDRKKVPYAGNCDIAVFHYSEEVDGSSPCLSFLGIAE